MTHSDFLIVCIIYRNISKTLFFGTKLSVCVIYKSSDTSRILCIANSSSRDWTSPFVITAYAWIVESSNFHLPYVCCISVVKAMSDDVGMYLATGDW